MAVRWLNTYNTGVDEIDRQHRRITEYLIQLDTHIKSGVYSGYDVELLMELLYEYLKLHFHVEENFLNSIACPIGEKNKIDNEKILNSIVEFNSEYFNSSVVIEKKKLVIELQKTLEEWLMTHLCRMDLSLKNCRNCNMS